MLCSINAVVLIKMIKKTTAGSMIYPDINIWHLSVFFAVMDSRESLWAYSDLSLGCAFPFSSFTLSKFESRIIVIGQLCADRINRK